jgi:hypothetical protein
MQVSATLVYFPLVLQTKYGTYHTLYFVCYVSRLYLTKNPQEEID